MMRGPMLKYCIALAIPLSLVLSLTAAERPPNILLLVSDDQRPDTIAALGNDHIRTPHLDDLVKRGLAFTRATCATRSAFPAGPNSSPDARGGATVPIRG